jgi:hypothetical protein
VAVFLAESGADATACNPSECIGSAMVPPRQSGPSGPAKLGLPQPRDCASELRSRITMKAQAVQTRVPRGAGLSRLRSRCSRESESRTELRLASRTAAVSWRDSLARTDSRPTIGAHWVATRGDGAFSVLGPAARRLCATSQAASRARCRQVCGSVNKCRTPE